MTDADTLRQAAAHLRNLATAASTDARGRDTSTWTSVHLRETDARLYGPDDTALLHGGSSGAHGRGTHPHLAPRHADYAATVDPTVGLLLAAWLDSAAVDAEQVGPDPEAVAVAHALLADAFVHRDNPHADTVATARAAGRADGLREAAAAMQDKIDRDRAQFPARSNDRTALAGARELVLGLLDKPADEAQR